MTNPAADLSLAARLDAVCDQFEQDFRAGKNPQIERCLNDSPEASLPALIQALVGLEVELRQKRGELPTLEEYQARFPHHVPAVQQAFIEVRSILSSVKVGLAETLKPSAAPPPSAPPENPKSKTLGRFQLLSVLGEGAFGTVYKARDPQLDREVAIKVPRVGSLPTDDDRQRFLREARSAANLQHALICPVYEVGAIDGRDYIVMAFIDGKTLAKVIQANAQLQEKQIVAAIRRIALALQEAHEKGIIHRDLKPANIMINRKGEPVIMDFGLARRTQSTDARISHSGQIMGTPAYMSPEQARGDGKAVGPAADIYSLGIIFYELLCGRRPFDGTITEVIGKILHVEPEPPSHFRADVHPQLQAICLKAIAKRPEDRFASMKEFAAALGDFLKSASAIQPATSAAADPAKEDVGATLHFANLLAAVSSDLEAKAERAANRAVQTHRPIPWWGYLAALGLLGAIVLTGIFLIRKETVPVIVNIPDIDPQDPTLTFLLDDQPIAAEKFLAPIDLKPGEHELVVKRNDEVFKRFLFHVDRANRQPALVREVTPESSSPARAMAPFDAVQARQYQERWAEHLGAPVQFENSVGMTMRLIPPGKFTMGTDQAEVDKLMELASNQWEKPALKLEAPARSAEIAEPFYLAEYETHVGAFREFVKESGFRTAAETSAKGGVSDDKNGKPEQRPEYTWQYPRFAPSDQHPVVQVTLQDAEAFCDWLSRREGRRYFVPDETQWEFACRAGTTTRWWNGDDPGELTTIAWTGKNTLKIQPIGLRPRNPFGLCDLLGNVKEICRGENGSFARGGRLWESPVSCRCASRTPYDHNSSGWVYAGFRIAAAVERTTPTADAPFSATKAREYQEAWAKRLGVPVEKKNSIGMTFRLIPPGSYRRGSSAKEIEALLALEASFQPEMFSSEQPAVTVRITRPFYLSVYETTFGQFRAFSEASGYVTKGEQLTGPKPKDLDNMKTWKKVYWCQTDSHPAVNISWTDADAFCHWLSKQESENCRLPTESEWEFACRAGTVGLWSDDNRIENLVAIGNVADSLAKAKVSKSFPTITYLPLSDGEVDPTVVGKYAANPFGLHDMIGNAGEWCSDWYQPYPLPSNAEGVEIDPQGPATGTTRVRRGGGSFAGLKHARSACRLSDDPVNTAQITYGFRVALAIGDQGSESTASD